MLAQVGNDKWALVLYGLLMGMALILGALLISLAGKWRRQYKEARLSSSDQLAQFRSLYDQGAISEEEYHRLRDLLGKKLRQELNIPSKAQKDESPRDDLPNPAPSSNGSPPAGPEPPV